MYAYYIVICINTYTESSANSKEVLCYVTNWLISIIIAAIFLVIIWKCCYIINMLTILMMIMISDYY